LIWTCIMLKKNIYLILNNLNIPNVGIRKSSFHAWMWPHHTFSDFSIFFFLCWKNFHIVRYNNNHYWWCCVCRIFSIRKILHIKLQSSSQSCVFNYQNFTGKFIFSQKFQTWLYNLYCCLFINLMCNDVEFYENISFLYSLL
jgi:hypothetical protein